MACAGCPVGLRSYAAGLAVLMEGQQRWMAVQVVPMAATEFCGVAKLAFKKRIDGEYMSDAETRESRSHQDERDYQHA